MAAPNFAKLSPFVWDRTYRPPSQDQNGDDVSVPV